MVLANQKKRRVLHRCHKAIDKAHLNLLKNCDSSPEDLDICRRLEAQKAARRNANFGKQFKKHKIVIVPKSEAHNQRASSRPDQEGRVPITKPLVEKRLGLTYRKQGVHKSPDEYIRENGGFDNDGIGCSSIKSFAKASLHREQRNAYRPNHLDTLPTYAVTLGYERNERGEDKVAEVTKSKKVPVKSNTTIEGYDRPSGMLNMGPYDPDEDDDHLNEDLPEPETITDEMKAKRGWKPFH